MGSVADNWVKKIDQKIFHARIIVDNEKVAAETKAYKKIPVINEIQGMRTATHHATADRPKLFPESGRGADNRDRITRIKNDHCLKQHLIPREKMRENRIMNSH